MKKTSVAYLIDCFVRVGSDIENNIRAKAFFEKPWNSRTKAIFSKMY